MMKTCYFHKMFVGSYSARTFLLSLVAAITTFLMTPAVFGAECGYRKHYSLMRAEALYPITATVMVRGGCKHPTMSLALRYNSHMSNKVVYFHSGHPKDYFGFSLLRVTPKQLEAMIEKMMEEFKKPKEVSELRKDAQCELRVPNDYAEKLVSGHKVAHPVYRSDSSKAYVSYIEEIDQYAAIAICSKARTRETDLAGIPDDPAGEQVFAPDYHGKYPLPKNLDMRKPFEHVNSLIEARRYANRRCEPYDTSPHSLDTNTADVCQVAPNLCDVHFEKKVELYCTATEREDCFTRKLWKVEDPRFDFAKGLRYMHRSIQVTTIDGDTSRKACVHWN